MTEDTEAVILNAIKYGDSSKIITAFTRSHGKIGLLAKGARMPKSKFGSSLEPLSVSEISYYYKSTRELQILTSAEQKFRIGKIYENPEKFACGLIILETVNLTNETSHANDELYNLIADAISELTTGIDSPFDTLARFFIIYCDLLGFGASFDGGGIYDNTEQVYISVTDSRLMSGKDASGFAFRMDRTAFNKIHALSLNTGLTIELNSKEGMEIIDFFSRYFSYHFDKRIKFKSQSLLLTESGNG